MKYSFRVPREYPRISTQKQLKTYIEKYNEQLSEMGIDWYYKLSPRKGCGYSALVRYVNGVGERKTICGQQGLPPTRMLYYLICDFNDVYDIWEYKHE